MVDALIPCICPAAVLGLMVLFVSSLSLRVVPEYKRLEIYRFGEYHRTSGPGVVFVIPIVERAITEDIPDIHS